MIKLKSFIQRTYHLQLTKATTFNITSVLVDAEAKISEKNFVNQTYVTLDLRHEFSRLKTNVIIHSKYMAHFKAYNEQIKFYKETQGLF